MAQAGTVTVLFTDLVGSTALRQSMGDDQADALRRQHDRMLREAIAAHGGTEVKGTGDGLMVAFGSSADAVGAAVDMQRNVIRFNRKAAVPIQLRIGISAGDVVWEDGDCFGTPVVEARRLCDAADGGQILTGEVVRLLAGSRGGHSFEPAGALNLKGLTEPLTASFVTWDAGSDGDIPLPAALVADDTIAFVGRTDERRRLEMAWKEASGGATRIMLVSGEPGVGKTRLVSEIARAAHREGATVLFGRCDEDFSFPYQPFVEALDAFVAHAGSDRLNEYAGHHGGDLARVLPRLEERVDVLPEAMHGEPEVERHHLFEAVRTFVDAMASDNPVLLVLDDLHWASKPTLLLLRHLVRAEGSRALLVLGTYRDTDLSRGHPLAEILASLRNDAGVERVDLQGLNQEEVGQVIEIAAGHDLDNVTAELARELFAETEGNPFFLGQTLRHLVETHAIVQQDGRWTRGPEAERVGIPEGVREVIGRRLSQFSDEANEVLSTAAVIGREFDAELLVASSTLDSEAVFDALEAGETARLIRGRPDRRGRYNFVHALVRSTLYEEIATTRRLRMHRRVGIALEERNIDDRHVDELARHFAEAAALGETERALAYGRRSAVRALERLAYEEAVLSYEQLIAVLDPDERDLALAAELHIELGNARSASGDRIAARASFVSACDLARRIGNAHLFARGAIGHGGRRGWTDAGVSDSDLVALLEEAIVLLSSEPTPTLAMVMARLASELYFVAGNEVRRQELVDRALAMVRQFDDERALGFVLTCAQFGLWMPGNQHVGLEITREVIDIAVSLDDVEMQFIGWSWRVAALWESGDADGARAAVTRTVECAERLRMPDSNWLSHVIRANVALFEGRLADAMQLMNDGLADGERSQTGTALQFYGVQLFAVCRMQGGLEALEPTFRSMVDDYPAIPAWRCGLIYLYLELGWLDQAREQFEVLEPTGFALPFDSNWQIGTNIICWATQVLDKPEAAALIYDRLLPFSELIVAAGMPCEIVGPAHLPLAAAAAALGRWNDVDAHMGIARAWLKKSGGRFWEARSAYEYARLLQEHGVPEDAMRIEELLAEARSIGDELGFTRLLELVDALQQPVEQ